MRDLILFVGLLTLMVALVVLIPGWLNNRPKRWAEWFGTSLYVIGGVLVFTAGMQGIVP